MARKIIYTEAAPDPIGPYSQGVFINGTLFISGQIALDAFANVLILDSIEKETAQVMDNIAAILEAAEMDFSNVVKTSIFLSDMDNFPKVNKVYGEYFGEHPPARETIEAARLPRDVNVEISVIAMR
ncbi:MAG TPA: Rid family detoxifying hydrolase [Chitinophagales bacterium]|nr:Rid family detoxifying hydrolase [Chitinophagales bacterium]